MSLSDALAEALAYADPPPPNEAATCHWVIYPLLRAIGYAPPEIQPQGSDNNGQFPDYAILPGGPYTWYVEAKSWSVSLQDSHAHQALNYANHNGKRWVVLTNGRMWRLYDNQIQGVAGDKLVLEVGLKDGSPTEEFLIAIGRASVLAGKLDDFARHSRLRRALQTQLADENSNLLKSIWVSLRKEPGLSDITRTEVAAMLSISLPMPPHAALAGSSQPPSSQSATVPPPPSPANPDPQIQVDGIGLDILCSQAATCVTGRKPTSVVLPDGTSRVTVNWRALAVEIVTWLGSQNKLPDLPFRGGQRGKLYFLNVTPTHEVEPMNAFHKVSTPKGDVFIHTHRSGVDIVSHLCDTCNAVGVVPAGFRVAIV